MEALRSVAQATSYKLQAASCKLQAASCKLQVVCQAKLSVLYAQEGKMEAAK
jgi:hypothetical protein